jgi:NIPSNAP protein
MKSLFRLVLAGALLMTGYVAGRASGGEAIAQAAQDTRVFEIRTYTTNEGKLDALLARFRNHTIRLFEKHGMTNVGYWTPVDPPLAQNTLIYIVAHPSREAAQKSWAAFGADPDWQKARTESEANGRINSKVESVFLKATDFSKIK